jgi:hypothetical protein
MWTKDSSHRRAHARASIVLCAVACCVGVLPAAAAEPRSHDGGFFLRLGGGGGPAQTSNTGVDLSGMGGDFAVAIGLVARPNFAVHANLFGWMIENPDVEFEGASGEIDTKLDLSVLGGGFTYWFGNSNAYVSPAVGIATVSADGPDLNGESDSGVAIDVMAGKEWWLSNRWGLGVAAGGGYHNVPDGDGGEFSGWNGALRVSATFN